MGERLVGVRVRLPASAVKWWQTVAELGGGGVPLADFLRRRLCEFMPEGERSALVQDVVAGKPVGRGLARASRASRRAVCAAGVKMRQAERAALRLLASASGRKRGPRRLAVGQLGPVSPGRLPEYLATEAGQALVRACLRALENKRPPEMPRGGWSAFDLWRAGGPPRGTAKKQGGE